MGEDRKPIELVAAAERADVLIPPAGLCGGTALRKAARRVSQLYDTVIAPTGLRSTQMAVLIHVARRGQPTMGELAGDMVIDRSALSDNLKPLVRQGFVEVCVCYEDRRTRKVKLTESGYAKLSASMPLWRMALERFDAAFGDDANTFRTALGRIVSDEFLAAFEGQGAGADAAE